MSKLIDASKLFEEVSEILDVPVRQLTNHMTLVEVIGLLVKELQEQEEHIDTLYAELHDGRS